MSIEKLANDIFNECAKEGEPIAIEEAMEMAQMKLNAKGISHNEKAATDKPKKIIQRNAQVSDEKKTLFCAIWHAIDETFGENAQIVKENKEIFVKIDEKCFKVDIIEHRNKK